MTISTKFEDDTTIRCPVIAFLLLIGYVILLVNIIGWFKHIFFIQGPRYTSGGPQYTPGPRCTSVTNPKLRLVSKF